MPRYARNRNGRGPVRIELGKLFDRLPPAAPEAEMALLGCMILDHQVIGDVVTIVRTGDDFSRPAHSAVFTALVELWNQHNAGDITILNQVLVDRGISQDIGGVEYLLQLAESVPVSTNATHYARIVAEKAVLRRLIGASGEILQQAYANPEDVRQALDRAEGLILAVQQASERNECVALPALLVETMADIERRSEGQAVTGLTSGFRDLDDMLSGLQASEMIVLAARPSMGKNPRTAGRRACGPFRPSASSISRPPSVCAARSSRTGRSTCRRWPTRAWTTKPRLRPSNTSTGRRTSRRTAADQPWKHEAVVSVHLPARAGRLV